MQPRDLFSPLPIIETPRVVLRKIRVDDAPDIFAYGSDPEVTEFLHWDTHRNIEETRSFISSVLAAYAKHPEGSWVIEHKHDKKAIGAFAYNGWVPAHKKATIGYVLSRAYWNQGLMSEVTKAMLTFGFTRMQLNRIYATCDNLNVGSWRVMEKCGMRWEALFRQDLLQKDRWRDTRLYAILRQDWKSEQ